MKLKYYLQIGRHFEKKGKWNYLQMICTRFLVFVAAVLWHENEFEGGELIGGFAVMEAVNGAQRRMCRMNIIDDLDTENITWYHVTPESALIGQSQRRPPVAPNNNGGD